MVAKILLMLLIFFGQKYTVCQGPQGTNARSEVFTCGAKHPFHHLHNFISNLQLHDISYFQKLHLPFVKADK